jgi:signal transduction histidine kinase
LVVGGPLQREHAPFLVGCARALTYATGILSLLRRLQKQQTDFTRTASFIGHHMKTPLQGALLDLREAALMTGASADEVRQRNTLLTDAESQIGLGLADALRLQGAAVATRKQRFDLYAQVAALVDDMRPLARAREIQIRLTPHAGTACVVLGVQLHVRVALSNLIENAIKYSYEEKSIEIRFSIPTTSSWQVVQIEIEDIGVGFPPEQKDRLFNLGTRLETASGKHARPGAGIGLMQAKEYLEAAGGSLDINSVPLATYTGHLSKVTALVHLPLA